MNDDKLITKKTVQQNVKENTLRNNNNFEECIICHCKTNIPVRMYIEEREYYVEGAGQLCPKCFKELFSK